MHYIKEIVIVAIFVGALFLFAAKYTPLTKPLVYITSVGGLFFLVMTAFSPPSDSLAKYLYLYFGFWMIAFIAPFYTVLRPQWLSLLLASLCTAGMLIFAFLTAWYVVYNQQGSFDVSFHFLMMAQVFIFGCGLAWLCKLIPTLHATSPST